MTTVADEMQCVVSMLGCLSIHVASVLVVPPAHLPDLYPVLTALYAFGHFALAWLYMLVRQWSLLEKPKAE